ncbi:uncharacterized protein YeaO (DUF488 family) [Streptomyces sp. Amel2xB2]|uniref:DUF488 domain-containing protein n=1 Tax=Streptomyces sp. Amel2xB2 TaxID=1305829 RepID=UPI000DB9EC73|nr:DUF488 family protein [Streptomyces sp. Amel2xB2]RAJ60650.1 uncharacterized protein YeaO (DUF488 family) [Streptomyces sp. Amel2xB2]
MTQTKQVRVRRVYDKASPRQDGLRVLVDGVWPRGMKKEDARLDEWVRQIAPSTGLRKWYGHDPERFGEFAERYRAELAEPEKHEHLDRLRSHVDGGTVTLLTAVKEEQLDYSHVAVLREELGG